MSSAWRLARRAHAVPIAAAQGFEQRRHMADPIGHDRAVDIDAVARINLGLTMQRQMIAIFGDEDMGEQRRTRPALLDRQRRHRRLHDRLAGAAAHLRAHMHDALEVRGDIFQHFALVGADPAELLRRRRSGRRRAHRGRSFLRQMIGQGRADGRLLRRRRRHGRFSRSATRASIALGFALLEIADQKFELFDC